MRIISLMIPTAHTTISPSGKPSLFRLRLGGFLDIYPENRTPTLAKLSHFKKWIATELLILEALLFALRLRIQLSGIIPNLPCINLINMA